MPTEFVDGDIIYATHVKRNNGQSSFGNITGGNDEAFTANITPIPELTGGNYPEGTVVHIFPHAPNKANATFSLNSGVPKNIVKDGQSLAANELQPNRLVSLCFSGDKWHLMGSGSGSGGGSSNLNGLTDVTIASPSAGQFLKKGAGDWINSNLQGSDITSGLIAVARLGSGTPDGNNYLRGDGVWAEVTSSSTSNLNGLTDVTISSPATGQVLRKSAGDWVNSSIQASDLPTHNHSGADITTGIIAAVHLGTGTPSAGKYLSGDGSWANFPSGTTSNLDSLTDVTLTSPATGQVLRKSAGDWVNSSIQASDLPTHNHSGADIISGTVAVARLGSGTPSSSNYLRGDGSWANLPGTSTSDLDSLTDVTISAPTTGQVLRKSAGDWINGLIEASDLPAHSHSGADITSGQVALSRGGSGRDNSGSNVGLGGSTLAANVTGSNNTAVGSEASSSSNTSHTTSVGYRAGQNNSSGSGKTLVGAYANQNGVSNGNLTAIGYQALKNSTSSNATAVGFNAGGSATSASNITLFGYTAGQALVTGSNNSAFGSGALAACTVGASNSAFGSSALPVATGSNNCALGSSAGSGLTSGSNNTLLGAFTGGITTGASNIVIGSGLTVPVATGSNQINLGGAFLRNNLGDLTLTCTGHTTVQSGMRHKMRTLTASGTIAAADYYLRADSTSALTLNLPSALGTGQVYLIKNVNSGVVTVAASGSGTIDGQSTRTLNQYETLRIIDASALRWDII